MKSRIIETEIFKEATRKHFMNLKNNAIKTRGLTTAEMREIRDLTEEVMSEVTTVGLIKEGKDQVVLIGRGDQ